MHRRNLNANVDVFQIFIDIILMISSYFVANFVYMLVRGNYVETNHLWLLIVFGVMFLSLMLANKMYNVTTFYYIDRVIQRTLLSATISATCVSAVIFLGKYNDTSRLFFLLLVAISLGAILVFRVVLRYVRGTNLVNGYTHMLFIGSEDMCEKYMQYIEKTSLKIKIDRRIDIDAPELESEDSLEALLVNINVNEIALVQSMDGKTNLNINSILQICEDMGITTRVLLDTYELPGSKRFVSSIGTVPVLTYHSISLDKVQIFFKSVMDVIGAFVGLVFFSPVFLFTALAIKIESPGPVMFSQVRVGKNGKKFKIYKFRSMYQDAEERKAELQAQNKIKGGLMFKMDDDPRITRVGKFIRKTSIDELPQLINVLKRDMSLVGTRPPTVDEVEKYKRHHHRRISIMPGITGMWQVSGRSEITDFEHVVELDKQYIEQWSVALDIKLIFKTVTSVLVRKGAS